MPRAARAALRDTRDSREAIFHAAAAEFAEHGFDAAGVDRIAARARVNKAMIYYHFGSKLGLYVEVLRDMFRAVGTRARSLADGPGSPSHKLDAWVATIVEEASARPWFPPIMLRELASGIPHFDPETLGLMSDVVAAVRDMIVQGQRDGSFRTADPLLTHLTIMPTILVFFVRETALAKRPKGAPPLLASPRSRDEFIRHMQLTVRGLLRKD
ncbi:MAG: TetR/AcrR family transcriptional regulator [Myxococcota bacterium]